MGICHVSSPGTDSVPSTIKQLVPLFLPILEKQPKLQPFQDVWTHYRFMAQNYAQSKYNPAEQTFILSFLAYFSNSEPFFQNVTPNSSYMEISARFRAILK
jgi:hypothetical protein